MTIVIVLCALQLNQSFQQSRIRRQVTRRRPQYASSTNNDNINEEYTNPFTRVLGAFVRPSTESASSTFDLNTIQWNEPKRKKARSLTNRAIEIEKALAEKEWFVTGNVDPTFFSDDFSFQDPDVKLKGIEKYARGVNKIFSQQDSRAEIIAARVNETVANTITVTWRLEGTIKVGPGLKIKPFVVYSDFLVNEQDGLIVFQLDRFSNPGYDIILSSLFPFLIGKVLLPPAPPADELKAKFLAQEDQTPIKDKDKDVFAKIKNAFGL